MRPLVLGLVFVVSCAHSETRALRKATRSAAKAARRSNAAELRAHVVAPARARVDYAPLVAVGGKAGWSEALKKPTQIVPEATVFLAPDHPVRVVWSNGGWRFAEDPGDYYSQATPRQALRALVRASREKRWGVLVALAPKRYRMGLSERDLERAWTEGEQAKALKESRDRLARHLADPIVADAHEAVLEMGEGHVARLEREADRWVVVDF